MHLHSISSAADSSAALSSSLAKVTGVGHVSKKQLRFFPKRISATLLALSLIGLATLSMKAQIEITKIGEYQVGDNAMPLGAFALHLRAHQDDAVVSFNGYQYCVYYSIVGTDTTQRFVTVGRRQLPAGEWETVALRDYIQRTDDSHNVPVIGIAEGDGTIHLSYDHHSSALNYRRSIIGLASNPEAHAWNASKFGNDTDRLGSERLRGVTYPRFFSAPNGDLQLVRREGNPHFGKNLIYTYDHVSHGWTAHGPYIDGTQVEAREGHSSPYLNPYLHGITYDGNDRLHASWVWRTSDRRIFNFDISYAYSDDRGLTWRNTDGAFVGRAGNNVRDPITFRDTPTVKVLDFQNLANQTGQAIDSKGRVHITQQNEGRFLHIYRDLDGVWHANRIGNVPSGRYKMTTDQNDNVYLITSSAVVYAATPGNNFSDWAIAYEGDRGRFSGDAQIDEARMKREGILSIMVAGRGSSTAMSTVDLLVSPVNQEPALSFGNGGVPGTGEPYIVAGSSSLSTRIEAENFDQGENGVSYNDSTPENLGPGSYRVESEVDIQNSSDAGAGSEIGFTAAGEWLQYTLNVESAGFYDLTFRYSKGSTRLSRMQAFSQGEDLMGEVEFATTNSFTTYQNLTRRVTLRSGPQVLRLQFLDGSMNLNHFTFTAVETEEIEMRIIGPLAESSSGDTWSDRLPAHFGANYIVPDQGQLRSDTGTSTFPGFSLRVKPGGRFQFRALESSQTITTVDNLILEGGTSSNLGTPAGLQAGTGSNDTNVLAGNINTSGHVRFLTFDSANNTRIARSMRVLSRISGDGRIELWEGLRNQGGEVVTITNPENAFSGVWEVGAGTRLVFENEGAVGSGSIIVANGTLQIDGDWNSGASLTLANSSSVAVALGNSHWTVDALNFGPSFAQDGVYTVAQLNALSTNPVFTGTGTITVGSVAPGGPVAHWNFDEGRGITANDATGQGHTGTLLHGAQWASDDTRGSFLSFDGEDDRVSTLFTYALSSSEDFTWSWWANQQSTGDTDRNALMVGNRFGGTGSESLEFIKFTPTQGEFRNGSGASYDYEDIVSGDWHHYAMVKTGDSFQWYLDGEAQGAAMTIAYSENDPLPFNIGGDDNNSTAGGQANEHFRGFIDEVVLYDRAISSAEVLLVRDATNGAAGDSPIAEWRRAYFDSEVNQGEGADDQDPDGDGESNLLEFATGQDPLANTHLATPLAMTPTGIHFTYTRSHEALEEGVSFQVLWSETLAEDSWSGADVVEAVAADDGVTQTVVATLPEATGGKMFARLRVSLSPL